MIATMKRKMVEVCNEVLFMTEVFLFGRRMENGFLDPSAKLRAGRLPTSLFELRRISRAENGKWTPRQARGRKSRMDIDPPMCFLKFPKTILRPVIPTCLFFQLVLDGD